MPELPEVETIRVALEPRVQRPFGRRRRCVPVGEVRCRTRGDGRDVQAVGRRGKYLVLELDDDRELVIHLGMTGVLRIVPDAQRSTTGSCAAWWELDDGSVLELSDIRRFGRVVCVTRGDYRALCRRCTRSVPNRSATASRRAACTPR